MQKYDLVVQLGSQVMYVAGNYQPAPHTHMRTEASALVVKNGIAPRLIISGGSNFGVRYNDQELLRPSIFTFGAFADADFTRLSEAAVIKNVLVHKDHLPSNQIFTEPLSATTEENAAFLKIILRRRPMFTGNERIAILTQLYHMEKALPVFREAGLNVEPLFVEEVLVSDPLLKDEWLQVISDYYTTPKGGKQYPAGRIIDLLTWGKSLAELMQ